MHHSLFIHLQKDIVDTPKFWQLGIKLLKHPLEGFWVNITFQLFWVNSKECNCLLMVRVCLAFFESTKLGSKYDFCSQSLYKQILLHELAVLPCLLFSALP